MGEGEGAELCKSVTFWQFCEKNLTVAGILRKNIWFAIPDPKIKFDPPPQGKSSSLNQHFFPDMEISSKS